MDLLDEDPDGEQWIGVLAGQRVVVPTSDFACRLDALARQEYGRAWDDLGMEEYINVLGEARRDAAYWLSHPRYLEPWQAGAREPTA